jgi:hypothetical protein
LRHYATRLKVIGSRPDEVNEFFSIDLIIPAALDPDPKVKKNSKAIPVTGRGGL